MTQQYTPQSINTEVVQEITLTTTSTDPVDVTIGALTLDGTGLTMQTIGGGFAPATPAAQVYRVRGNMVVAREAGAASLINGGPLVSGTGGVPTITVVGVGDLVVLRITPGTALEYAHKILLRGVMSIP